MSDRSDRLPAFSATTIGLCALVYGAMLIYGTLYPFQGWRMPEGGFFQHFLDTQLLNLSRTDLVLNVLVYMPAGLLLACLLARRLSWTVAIGLATLIGMALSLALETTQVFLPARTSALSDLLLNSAGALIGGSAALVVSGKTWWGLRLHGFRQAFFLPGALVNIGFIVLGLWCLSQLSPLVPSPAISNLRDGLKPIWHSVTGQSSFVVVQSLVYCCYVLALGGIFLSLSRSRRVGLLLFALLVFTVLLLKVPVVSRQLSLEALLGCTAAIVILSLLQRVPIRWLLICAGCLLLSGYVMDTLRVSDSMQLYSFNWVPFKGHMQRLTGLANILESGWVFLAAGYILRYVSASSRSLVAAWIGAVFIAGLAALLEAMQLGIPGRVPDITDVIIAVAAWGCAWLGGLERTERNAHPAAA